ncbi:MAG: hypothetical protein EPO54_01455 [Brevundimonas sp.]|jgi:hypothetical protein|nr:MAG: hypothetical protein EPO54_01455 [Brevundimonas sp.]
MIRVLALAAALVAEVAALGGGHATIPVEEVTKLHHSPDPEGVEVNPKPAKKYFFRGGISFVRNDQGKSNDVVGHWPQWQTHFDAISGHGAKAIDLRMGVTSPPPPALISGRLAVVSDCDLCVNCAETGDQYAWFTCLYGDRVDAAICTNLSFPNILGSIVSLFGPHQSATALKEGATERCNSDEPHPEAHFSPECRVSCGVSGLPLGAKIGLAALAGYGASLILVRAGVCWEGARCERRKSIGYLLLSFVILGFSGFVFALG